MSKTKTYPPLAKIPTHVAIIMDGNGRWARARGLPRLAGHRAGTDNLRRIIVASTEFGIQYLTVYAFSTENWGRPQEEVSGLMNILEDAIQREVSQLHQEGVQIRHIGRLDQLRPSLRKKIQESIELTRNNQRLVLCVALNYGGRDEILYAIRNMIKDGIAPDQITAEIVSQYLFTRGIPDPDLIIRTSGEMRFSNFLIWQSAYSEWYVTPTLWPDFNKEELYKALEDYNQRERRFGLINPPSQNTEDSQDAS